MKIIYVGKHGPQDNQDEDSITYALQQLGHEVRAIPEKTARAFLLMREGQELLKRADFLLFNKWEDVDCLKRLSIPKAFWYFDLINSDDWELQNRSRVREKWMREVTPLCVTGFCTDGDWVREWNKEVDDCKAGGFGYWGCKLYWLMQGADERVTGPGTYRPELACDILFTGSTIHGGKRISHVKELQTRYGPGFKCIGDNVRERVHGRALADLYASAKIIIAPDGPVTDRYWSNRVYLTLGFGGFLLHPQCLGLRSHYSVGELYMYGDRNHLNRLIDRLLSQDEDGFRAREAANGYAATMRLHLYRHRCAELIKHMESVL